MFFGGFCKKTVCRTWCFAGVIVVNCVVNVVFKHRVFRWEKNTPTFLTLFLCFRVVGSGEAKISASPSTLVGIRSTRRAEELGGFGRSGLRRYD